MWSFLYLIAQYLWPFAITLFLIKLYQWWEFPHPRFPPGPRGLPILGIANKMAGEKMTELEKDYGSIVGGKMIGMNTVVLNRFEDIHDAFTKHGSVVSDRPPMHVFNDATQGFGLVEKNYNTVCKLHRKFGSSFFKGFLCSGMNIESICADESHHFIEDLMKQKQGMPIDLRLKFFNVTVNVISHITLGHRFDYDDTTIWKIVKSSTKIHFCCEGYQHVLCKDFIQQKIDEHKQHFDPDNVKDFIDAFLKEQKFGPLKNQPHFNDAELGGLVKDLYLAGTETSSNTLAWAVAILLHNPDYIKKMQQEIDNLLGPDEQLTLSHRDLMPMSCAIIQEVMRCRTLVPFGVPHCTSEDVDFRQYRLAKNTLVSGNLWAVHNNPEVWDKPHEFNPYRHLDEDGKFVASPHVIPFGVGLRRCLGERIAKIEIFFFLVSLFRYFNVLPDQTAKKLPEIDKGLQMIVFSPHTYKVVLQKRLPA